jgi:hypothetical protein
MACLGPQPAVHPGCLCYPEQSSLAQLNCVFFSRLTRWCMFHSQPTRAGHAVVAAEAHLSQVSLTLLALAVAKLSGSGTLAERFLLLAGFRLASNEASGSTDVAQAVHCLAQAVVTATGLTYNQEAALAPSSYLPWYSDPSRDDSSGLYT